MCLRKSSWEKKLAEKKVSSAWMTPPDIYVIFEEKKEKLHMEGWVVAVVWPPCAHSNL